jgi:hypothetical protein
MWSGIATLKNRGNWIISLVNLVQTSYSHHQLKQKAIQKR